MSQRTRRLDELLRQEIGAILAREVTDPRIGFATVTEVETAPDLRHARVWVSVIGSAEERTETLAALERAMVFVRRELGHRLRLKRIPELHIRLDDSAERGTRVLRLLTELEAGHDVEDLVDETLPTPVPRIAQEGDASTTEDELQTASNPPSSTRRPRRDAPPRASAASQGRSRTARHGRRRTAGGQR